MPKLSKKAKEEMQAAKNRIREGIEEKQPKKYIIEYEEKTKQQYTPMEWIKDEWGDEGDDEWGNQGEVLKYGDVYWGYEIKWGADEFPRKGRLELVSWSEKEWEKRKEGIRRDHELRGEETAGKGGIDKTSKRAVDRGSAPSVLRSRKTLLKKNGGKRTVRSKSRK